jgi:hypothetical protein
MGALAKILDAKGNLIHEDTFFRDSDWDDTLDGAFTQIVFEGDEIFIGPGFYDRRLVYIIRRSDFTGHYRSLPAALVSCPPSNKSLDRSGGSVFCNIKDAAKVE